MKSLGQAGMAFQRAKLTDFDKAIAILAAVADGKASKAHLQELRDAAQAEADRREEAEAMVAKATARDAEARQAEADAVHARQVLADESAATSAKLDARERAVAEREQAANAREAELGERGEDFDRRERLLRQAGVTFDKERIDQ